MKQNIKRILLVLCMVTCLFSLSACSQKAQDVGMVDPSISDGLKNLSEQTLQQFASMGAADLESAQGQAQKNKNSVLATGLDAWSNVMDEMGALKSVDSILVEEAEDGYMITLEATFEKRRLEFKMGVNEEISGYTSLSFNPEYTLLEKLEQAFLNMVIGMGTVFTVLILISLVIGSFKFIHEWEERAKAGGKTAELSAVPVRETSPAPAEEELTDDLELVAVITAAIAASENTSADGLVVRSIRRARNSKWKNA